MSKMYEQYKKSLDKVTELLGQVNTSENPMYFGWYETFLGVLVDSQAWKPINSYFDSMYTVLMEKGLTRVECQKISAVLIIKRSKQCFLERPCFKDPHKITMIEDKIISSLSLFVEVGDMLVLNDVRKHLSIYDIEHGPPMDQNNEGPCTKAHFDEWASKGDFYGGLDHRIRYYQPLIDELIYHQRKTKIHECSIVKPQESKEYAYDNSVSQAEATMLIRAENAVDFFTGEVVRYLRAIGFSQKRAETFLDNLMNLAMSKVHHLELKKIIKKGK